MLAACADVRWLKASWIAGCVRASGRAGVRGASVKERGSRNAGVVAAKDCHPVDGFIFSPFMILRNFLPLLPLVGVLALGGCASVSTENSELSSSSSGAAIASGEEAPASRSATATGKVDSLAEKPAIAAAGADTPRSTFRAEREARAATATNATSATATSAVRATNQAASSSDPRASSSDPRASTTGETAKLIQQLGDASKELATLRAANAKFRAERAQPAKAAPAAALIDPADEKLSASLKSYAAFKQEVGNIFSEVERVRQENTGLSSQLKTAVEQSDRARAATARLEADLRAEQKSRAEAEKTVMQLRDQLRAVARAVSAAGLSVDKLSGAAEVPAKR